MRTTDLVAWIGASTGVASLIWNIYSKLTADRPKLVVRAYANMVQMPPPPKNPRFLRITVQNNGTAPTTITNVEFFKMLPGWKRFLYRLHLKKWGEEIHAVLNDFQGLIEVSHVHPIFAGLYELQHNSAALLQVGNHQRILVKLQSQLAVQFMD
jgi:hypothetical protein